MAKKYCENCGRAQKTRAIRKTENYTVLKDVVEEETEYVLCDECSHVLSKVIPDEERLLDAYRKKHKLLLPREIKAIREQYQLSRKGFSRLLHWGDKTIAKYENGLMPDHAHNSLLLMMRNPENMRLYIENNDHMLSKNMIQKLLRRIDELTIPFTSHGPFFRRYFSDVPSKENGYKAFDYHTVCAMVLYFAGIQKDISKMRLMDYLYFSDMLYFDRYGVSMSGMRYIRRSFGAVYENMDILFGIMEADHLIRIEVQYYRKYNEHVVNAECEYPFDILNESQFCILQEVHQKYAGCSERKMLRRILRDSRYLNAGEGGFLSYEKTRRRRKQTLVLDEYA